VSALEWKNMNEEHEENGQFRLRLDKLNEEAEDPAIPTEVNELKLEKISQRVTLISILIPVLIVIVLVIAYLDIKKRVVRTEDTGEIEFQKLSTDLDSRFSSLSLRQAKLEEMLEKTNEQSNHATAAIQVRLEKLNDNIKEVRQRAIGTKELDATKAEMVKQVNSVIESANQAGEQIAAITKELKSQMDRLNQALAAANLQIDAVDRKLTGVDRSKIDKPALDLAIRLEALKLETAMKSKIQELQSKIGVLEDQLARRATQTAPTPPPSPSAPVPKPGKPDASAKPPNTTTPPKADTPPATGSEEPKTRIEEQTIGK